MAKNNAPLSEIEKEFRRERKRVNQLLRRMKKRGFIIPESLKPSTLKSITKSDVIALQSITPDYIYSISDYRDPISKEFFTGEQGYEIEQHRRNLKRTKTKKPTTVKKNVNTAPKPRTSQVEKEYTKELERIKSFLKRAKERGYIFPDDILGERPKHPTAEQLKTLKALTPPELYAKAVYIIDSETGEVITGTEQRQRERKKASEKAKITRSKEIERPPENNSPDINDSVLNWIINTFQNTSFFGMKQKQAENIEKYFTQGEIMLNNAILKYGRSTVAQRLEENGGYLQELIDKLLSVSYDEYAGQVLNALYEVLNDVHLSVTESKRMENYFDDDNAIMTMDELGDILTAASRYN